MACGAAAGADTSVCVSPETADVGVDIGVDVGVSEPRDVGVDSDGVDL